MTKTTQNEAPMIPLEVQKKAFAATSNHLKNVYGVNIEDQHPKAGILRSRFLRLRGEMIEVKAKDLEAMQAAFPEFNTIFNGYVEKYIEEMNSVSNEALMARIDRIEKMLVELLQRK